MKTEIGGDRLGSGNKQSVSLRNYERSTHDLGYIWRSSMASGTLVPFMSEVGLPGDSFDIDLDLDVKTLPTVGPLFGSYKVQLDVFQCPVRLYQGKLHMNMLNIGMDMSEVMLPQVKMRAKYTSKGGDNSQVSSSSIYSYLNIRGLGRLTNGGTDGQVERWFNAIPLLSYWDIYKNYYANKQEERGFVIHGNTLQNDYFVQKFEVTVDGVDSAVTVDIVSEEPVDASLQGSAEEPYVYAEISLTTVTGDDAVGNPDLSNYYVGVLRGTTQEYMFVTDIFSNFEYVFEEENVKVICTGYKLLYVSYNEWYAEEDRMDNTIDLLNSLPQLTEFPLDNIDTMRMDILQAVKQTVPFEVTANTYAPYGLGLGQASNSQYYATVSQEGLGIKTYQSDLFNNWISTEWIDGSNGINEVTAVSTSTGEFTIDALNLANKVYNMLNRIAISGGSYDDWLDAVYTHERAKSTENPIYMGSLIKELAFEEVVSMSDVDVDGETQPLGTLAGRGRLTSKNKGGRIKIKVDEPSYIIGIASLTPRVDYSQGNKWDTNLKTMNDLHKPALDEIGYQDLITDQMAWFDTYITPAGEVKYSSAGKQPAWINYMTNVNQTRGHANY